MGARALARRGERRRVSDFEALKSSLGGASLAHISRTSAELGADIASLRIRDERRRHMMQRNGADPETFSGKHSSY
jgi:hypothetical protein